MDENLNIDISRLRTAASGHVLDFRARITRKDDRASPPCVLRVDRSHPHPDPQQSNPLQLRELTFEIQAPGCTVLDSSNIRVPISHYIEEAIEAANREAGVFELPPPPPRGKRGRRVTSELLEDVTTIYRRAVDEHKYPLREIALALGVSHPTAARYVMQAREAKLLGPAPAAGFAGEAT